MTASPQVLQQPPATGESDETLTTTSDEGPQLCETEAEKAIPPKPMGPPPKVVIIELVKVVVMLWVLFWAVSCFINGKMYGQQVYSSRLNILTVDLDGGPIGTTLHEVTTALNGEPRQPTYRPISKYKNFTYEETYNRVYRGDAWGAIIAMPNATSNLLAALTTKDRHEPYDPSLAFTIIRDESRYPTVQMSLIYSNMVGAVNAINAKYQQNHGREMIERLPKNSTEVNRMALLHPISFREKHIVQFDGSNTFLYNTVMFVFPILSQFFLVVTMNGACDGMGVYRTWSLKRVLLLRYTLSVIHGFIIAISWAGWVFIFRYDMPFSSSQFGLLFLPVWLACMINFSLIDSILAQAHMKFGPFIILPWVITQISAAISPVGLANQWYRIEYVLPAHHLWGVLMTVFSRGANNQLKINLTVLFMWWIIVVPLNLWSQKKRLERVQGVARRR